MHVLQTILSVKILEDNIYITNSHGEFGKRVSLCTTSEDYGDDVMI